MEHGFHGRMEEGDTLAHLWSIASGLDGGRMCARLKGG